MICKWVYIKYKILKPKKQKTNKKEKEPYNTHVIFISSILRKYKLK